MKKNVVINIKGTQKSVNENKPDVIEFLTTGIYVFEEQKITVDYIDSSIDADEKVNTKLEFDNKTLIITRSGNYKSQMILEKGKRHISPYITPFGEFTMGVYTNEIKSNLNENGGILVVEYDIELNHMIASNNSLELSIREDV